MTNTGEFTPYQRARIDAEIELKIKKAKERMRAKSPKKLQAEVDTLVEQNKKLVEMLESVVELHEDSCGDSMVTHIALAVKRVGINQLLSEIKGEE